MSWRVLWVVLALPGCAARGVGLEALPEAPIAFVYRSVEETERVLDEVKAQKAAAQDSSDNKLDLRLDRIEQLAGVRTEQDRTRDQQGHLALFVAPERRLELPESLPRGARPLDWSEAHRLMFSWIQRDTYHLFEWNPETGEIGQLTSGPESQIAGCYGPGGAIAFVQIDGPEGKQLVRIWVRRPGEAPHPVSEGPLDTQPSWSPTGERIVFVARHGRDESLLRWVDALGGGQGVYGPGRTPHFSPDGEWIVYSAHTEKGWRLRLMHTDGSGKRALGASAFEESDPWFSPDGRFVVFSVTRSKTSALTQLFVRSVDGSVDRQLDFAGSGLLPVW